MDRGQVEHKTGRVVCLCLVDIAFGNAYHKFLHQFGGVLAHKIPRLRGPGRVPFERTLKKRQRLSAFKRPRQVIFKYWRVRLTVWQWS